MKKLIALALIVCFLLPCGVSAYETEENFEKDIQTIKAIGIMQGNEKGEFMPDECITRAEFAKIVCVLSGWTLDVTAYDETGFSDLDGKHWAYPYIYYTVSRGYMAGYKDGTFRPDECITGTEAAKVLIHLLGYEFKANDMGGYPDGYDSAALTLGIYDDLSFDKRDYILRCETARLINNALDVPLVEFSSAGSEGYKYIISETKTLLTEKLSMIRGKAVVTANEYASVKGDSLTSQGKIKIDGIVADYAGDSDELLGNRYEYICSFDKFDEDKKEIVYLLPVPTKTFEIKAEDYVDFSDNSIKYKDQDDTIRSVKVSQSADYIYNGSNKEYKKELYTNMKLGKILLSSTDGNVYDVVKITDSSVMKVGDINLYAKKITDENDNSRYIDFSDTLKVFDVKNTKGDSLDISSVKIGDVLTVTEGEYKTEIIVSDNSISGKLEFVSADDGEIGIGGETVKLDYYFIKYNGNPAPGQMVTVYKDAYGYAAYLKYGASDVGNIAYIVKIGGVSTPEGENLKVKMYTTAGNFISADFTDNPKINGVSVKNPTKDRVLSILGGETLLVKYEITENGEISLIEGAKPYAALEGSGADGLCNMYVLKNRCNMKEGSNFDFEVYYNSSTIFMKIPNDIENADENDFKILDMNSFVSSVNYNVEGYTESISDVVATVIVTKDDVSGAFEGHDIAGVVEKIVKINDADRGHGVRISILAGKYGSSSKEFTVYSYDEDGLTDDNGYKVTDLKSGDVIKLMYNNSMELTKFLTYYKHNEDKWLSKELESKTAINRIYPRTVDEVKKGFAKLSQPDDATNTELHDLSKLHIIVVRKTGSSTVVYTGSVSDVNSGDKAIIQTISRMPMSLVVFK